MTSSKTRFRLCTRCSRAVPYRSAERYCINDGTVLLEACPRCQAAITSPHARHCAACGYRFADALEPASAAAGSLRGTDEPKLQ